MENEYEVRSFWHIVALDLRASIMMYTPSVNPLILKHVAWGCMLRPNFACVFWYRVNRFLYLHKLPGQRHLYAWRTLRFANDISFLADIGPGFCIKHLPGIVIGGSVKIGENVVIFNGVTIGQKNSIDKSMPVVGNNVRIYTDAKVLGPIHVGDNSIIGTMSLCNKDVPENSVMYGIPPNVAIKKRTT